MTDMRARPGETVVPGENVAVMAEPRWGARVCVIRGTGGDKSPPATPATPDEMLFILRVFPHVARMVAAAEPSKGN